MVSDLKTFAHKGCKDSTQKVSFFGKFGLSSRIFSIVHYNPHRSRDSLSPVCGFFFVCFGANFATLRFSESFEKSNGKKWSQI